MKNIMDFEIYLKEHIKRIEPDNEKIKSIRKMCEVRLKIIRHIELDEETASVISTDYYEVIKELLTALLLKNGLKSDNHECLISFFRHKFPQYRYESNILHQLKNVCNRVSYDGIFVKKGYVSVNKLEFEHIIELLNRSLEE